MTDSQYMPDFEVTPDLLADWQDWYGSPVQRKYLRARREAIERFAAANNLTEFQAQQVRRYAEVPNDSDEAVEQNLTDMIVNSIYGDDGHAPWAAEYVEARKIVDRLLGYSSKNTYVGNRAVGEHRGGPLFSYPDEVEEIRNSELGKKFYLDKSDVLDFAVSLLKKWDYRSKESRYSADITFPRREDWTDLDAVSPNTPQAN